jgi:hypothetical protein
MKLQFKDVALQCWVYSGKLGTQSPCLCLQGDANAAAVLLTAVEELNAEGPPARRTITLLPHSRLDPIQTIRLHFSPLSDDLRQMSLTHVGEVATFEFTPLGLCEFRDAIIAWRDGTSDFGLSPSGSRKARDLKKQRNLGPKDLASGELWFWTPFMEP